MSVAGISSSSFFNYNTQSVQNRTQMQQEFQQLGQDLQSGNLSAAKLDCATLQQLQSHSGATSSTQGGSTLMQEFNQLSSDLKSGNLSAAQQDYATIRQDMQNRGVHGHHHYHGGGGGGEDELPQLVAQLGQSLQSGNISSAQQAYNALLQDLPPGAGVSAVQTSQTMPTISATA
jgi:hypothetical protein